MTYRPTRRRLLQTGATLSAAGLGGCESAPQVEGGGSSEPTVTATPTFVISKTRDTVVAVDAETRTRVYEGRADEDDARVIQQALDDQRLRDGGSVFFRHATYEIGPYDRWGAGLKVHTSDLRLVSDLARLRFHHHSGSKTPKRDLAIDQVENVLVRGLHLDGNKADRTAPTRTLDSAHSTNVTVRDCIVENGRKKAPEGGAGYGIAPFECDHFVVHNCVIRHNDRHGVHPGSNSEPMKDYRITNCSFIGNATNPSGAAVDLRDGSTRTIVANNYFEGNGNGVRIKGEDPADGYIQVSNNVFWDNRVTPEQIEAVDAVGEITGSAQIDLSSPVFDTIDVSDNLFYLPTAAAVPDERRHLSSYDADGRSLLVHDNHFRGGSSVAVGAFADTRRIGTVVVEGNHFEDPPDGVAVADGIQNAVVRGNTFDYASAGGGAPVVTDDRFQTAVVVDNVVYGNSIGDAFAGSENAVLRNNVGFE